MRTVSLILGHPSPGSFNHGIAERVRNTLARQGWTVHFHDLYAEGFDPVLPAAEIPEGSVLPPEVALHCNQIESAQGIVIIHPNWWSQPPAVLKGWVDRVLRPGQAYRFVEDGQGGGKPEGLLPARSALVFNTANNPQEKEVELLGDPLEVFWRKCVFGLCGVPHLERHVFAPVILSQPAQRQAWLEEVEQATVRLFGDQG